MYHLILCVLRGILSINYKFITMERRCGQYSVTNCGNVGAMLGCRCDVSAFDLRKSMCRPLKIDVLTLKIDDRCVDLRRWMVDVPTFEDRWSLCRPSKTDDRCEIMLLHLLKTLMV